MLYEFIAIGSRIEGNERYLVSLDSLQNLYQSNLNLRVDMRYIGSLRELWKLLLLIEREVYLRRNYCDVEYFIYSRTVLSIDIERYYSDISI